MKASSAFCAMIFAAGGLLAASAGNAQQQSTPSSPPTPAPDRTAPDTKNAPANIPDHKLDAAAAAAKRVVALSDNYEQKLAKASGADKEKIVDEANEAIAKAVTDQGLSIDEYVSIMKTAQNDPAVRDKLVQRLK
jgi:hypothetical protein